MKGFVIVPRRGVVERTFSWFGRSWRLAKDFENLAETLATFFTLASSSSLSGGLPGRRSRVCKGLDSRPSPGRNRTTGCGETGHSARYSASWRV